MTDKDARIRELEDGKFMAESLQEEIDEGDYWMKRAERFISNGGCPTCFCTDEGPHENGCLWSEMESRLALLEKVAEAARDVFSDELKLRATTGMPFNFNTEREVRDLSKLADKLTALYAALDAAKEGK